MTVFRLLSAVIILETSNRPLCGGKSPLNPHSHLKSLKLQLLPINPDCVKTLVTHKQLPPEPIRSLNDVLLIHLIRMYFFNGQMIIR